MSGIEGNMYVCGGSILVFFLILVSYELFCYYNSIIKVVSYIIHVAIPIRTRCMTRM